MRNLLAKISIFLLIIGGTLLVIYYAKGYRINFTDNTLVKTGILHIETQPTRANFWLTEDFTGRTPRIVTSVPEGEYTLDLWLEGYHGIKYDIEIFAERSTPISIFFFRKEPEIKIAEEIEGEVINIHIDQGRNNALFLIKDAENEGTNNYKILRYQTSTRFWQLRNNPHTLYTFSTSIENKVTEVSISPNSKNILLTVEGQLEETLQTNQNLPQGKHLISLDTQTILAEISQFAENVKWSQDGETIVWQDNQGINKINLKEPETPVLVYAPKKNTEILYYDSYTNGEIYLLLNEQSGENSHISLSRVSQDLEETYLIEKIFYQDENESLRDIRDNDFLSYKTFINSPDETLLIGEPKTFLISKENQVIVFKTENASYLYDIEEDIYTLLNPYETEILHFSPDGKKISFLSLENEKLGFFRFDKEINNYSTRLGGKYLDSYINKDVCTDFAWHQNSQNIYYVCEETLYVSDIRTDGNITLIQDFGKKILLEGSNKILTTLEKDKSLDVIEYTIN